MKKIAVALVLLLLTTIVVPVSATENNMQHGHRVSVHEDEHGRIIREYRNYKKSQDREYTYSVLTDLGMSEAFLVRLSDEKIGMYANAENIISITTYTREDAAGNIEIIDEDTAIEGVISTMKWDPPTMDDFDGDYTFPTPTYSNSTRDTYMKITFVVTYKGNAAYHFSVDAEWLTTPDTDERYYDAIGISASYITIQNSTRTGWFSYVETKPLLQDGDEDKHTSHCITLLADDNCDGQLDYIRNCVNGNWIGSGAVFSFPTDTYKVGFSDDRIKLYSNFKAHYEFDGIISQPSLKTSFSAVASYDHYTVKVTAQPSLELSSSGASFSLTLTPKKNHDHRIVELEDVITYEP